MYEYETTVLTLNSFSGLKSSPNTIRANLVAFHSLLQNLLYPSTRSTSRLISRPRQIEKQIGESYTELI